MPRCRPCRSKRLVRLVSRPIRGDLLHQAFKPLYLTTPPSDRQVFFHIIIDYVEVFICSFADRATKLSVDTSPIGREDKKQPS